MKTDTTKVLVVGGGLAGLSSAVWLAWHKVPHIMIDKYPGSSPHPRAVGFTERTTQILRVLGLSDKVPQADPDFVLRRARVHSLTGEWLEEMPWTPGKETPDMGEFSPTRGASLAQDRMEPILREKAEELGSDIRLSTEMTDFEQDENCVTATVRERNGNEYQIRADYMIGADGHSSPIREKLGLTRDGIGHIRTIHSIMFRCPKIDAILEKGITQFEIDQGEFTPFLTTYSDGRWVIYYWDTELFEVSEQKRLILRAIGDNELAQEDVEIITSGGWEMTGLINHEFSKGRVFLAGDSAHTLPPSRGGYGANTGISDALNIAWKLESVVSGKSTPALLETYNAERQPIAKVRHDQAFARPDYERLAKDKGVQVELFDDISMELGQLYRSSAVIGAGSELPAARRPDEWAGQPGTIAPHMWVSRQNATISTMDLFLRGWVLLTEDNIWAKAAKAAGEATGIPIEVIFFGSEVEEKKPGQFLQAYGLDAGGATLVRPDGYIAWRSVTAPADPARELTNALAVTASASKMLAAA